MLRYRVALCALIALALGPSAVSAADTYQGTLSIVWGDPLNRASAGDVRYILETPDRQYIEVEVGSGQSPNELLRLQGQRVVVTGQMAARSAFASVPGDRAIVAT